MNRVTHFEIPTGRPEKSLKFYGDVFGWNFQQFGDNEYWLAITGDNEEPGINGAIMKKKDPAQPVVNSIEVDSVDAAAASIEANGGAIVVPKMAIPGVGWVAYFKDPDRNIFGIFQTDEFAK